MKYSVNYTNVLSLDNPKAAQCMYKYPAYTKHWQGHICLQLVAVQ